MPHSFLSLHKCGIFIFAIRRYLLLKKVLLLCILILWTIAACSPPPPAKPTPTPSSTLIAALSIVTGGPCEVAVGQTMPLAVSGMSGPNVVYRWTASAGNVSPSDGAAVTYIAPNTPGDVIIRVDAEKNGVASEAIIICKVVGSTPTPENTATLAPTFTAIATSTFHDPSPLETPNPTQVLEAAFNEIDKQFQETLKSVVAYNAPQEMKLDETVTIELLLNPSQSKEELSTQLVKQSDLLTSTAEPGQLVTDQGGKVIVETDEVLITDHMKAVLRSRKLGAFEIQELHDNAEQIVSGVETTKWRWSVTAKEEGERTLDLVLYRLVKYGDEEHWREVESYRTDITVEVTTSQRFKSFDWKWLLGILLVPLFFWWLNNRNKKNSEQEHPRIPKRRYRS